jgi:hypothetical protein
MASLLACFKCRLEIRVKQQKVKCSSCKNRFHRVLCSGISTKDWKENSVLLKTAFVCFDCIPVPQTGGSFSPLVKSPSAASPFHGFPSLVYDVPSFNAFHDSFLTTSHSTSVLNDFSNLAIDVTNHINDLQVSVTEASPVAANNFNFNLQEYMDDLSSRNKISTNVTNDSVSEAVMPINAVIVCPNLSPAIPTCTNGFIPDSADISFAPRPPPGSPSPEFNILSPANSVMILFNPNLNSSTSVDGAVAVFSPGAAAIEWHHSPTVSPPGDRPTYDAVEVPINRTPDRPLRELKYTFHDKCSNKKSDKLFDGLGFRYSKGPKSLTWR